MANSSGIEWTEATWNPVAGCSMVSPGCSNCYAMKMAHRLEGMGQEKYAGTTRNGERGAVWTGKINLDEAALTIPLGWKKPRRVFVNSMSDLFHEDIPEIFIDRVFATMAVAQQHDFQILTKRPERAAEYLAALGKSFARLKSSCPVGWSMEFQGLPLVRWPLPNVWLGTSIENQDTANERLQTLLNTPAAVRWVSFEPLLGPIDIHQAAAGFLGLHWAVIGGESGPGARGCNLGWIRSLRDQLRRANRFTGIFVKQLGSRPVNVWTTRGGWTETDELRLQDRKGGKPDEWPDDLRIREFPEVANGR